ncbi:MAG: hypothetical protein JNM18_10645 [Planctomycetaceae bacterium]|nr:hypothetical protein [Planctomycetaceae bacterium]
MPVQVPQQAEDESPVEKRDGEAMVVFEDVDELLQQVAAPPYGSAASSVMPTTPAPLEHRGPPPLQRPAESPPPPAPTYAAAMSAAAMHAPPTSAPQAAYVPQAAPAPMAAAMTPLAHPAPGHLPPGARPAATPRSNGPRTLVHPELVLNYMFLRRSVIYWQAVVLLLVIAGAFLAGWVAGNQAWLRSNLNDPSVRSANLATVVVNGSVAYETATGRQADTGAMIMLLPLGSDHGKLRLANWKGPAESTTLPSEVSDEIHAVHGDITLVKADGSFEIVVPRAGEYQMLVISANSRRPMGQLVNKKHEEEMAEWLESPASLIGWQLYLWQPQRIEAPAAPIELFFPMSP